MVDTSEAKHVTVAERIIDAFGGVANMADLMGHKYPSRVQYWKESGRIPAQNQPEVMRVAEREGIDLTEILVPATDTEGELIGWWITA